jgi:hypothetical protein
VDRNESRAQQYVCSGHPELSEIEALLSEAQSREKNFGVSVSITWGPLTVSITKSVAIVETDITISGSSEGVQRSSRTNRWTFTLRNQSGWHVCSAHQIS